MAQSISEYFQAALVFLLEKEGRGAQSRLARQQGIDRGYLNAIVKGRKAGADAVRAKIADHFDMTYEDMLALGRETLEKREGRSDSLVEPEQKIQKAKNATYYIGEDTGESSGVAEERPKFISANMKMAEIFKSNTAYGEILAGLIDAFHEAVSMTSDNQTLKNRIRELEARLAHLEKKLDN